MSGPLSPGGPRPPASSAGAGEWEVHRRWVTRLGRDTIWRRVRRRFRRSGERLDVLDGGGCGVDAVDGIVGVIVTVVVVLLVLFVVLPLLLAVVDVLVVLVLALLGFVGRIAFRRPWAIDAFAEDGTHLRWRVIGWRASGDRLDEIVETLRSGVVPPGAEVLASPPPPPPPPPPSPGPAPGWDGTAGPFGST